ncbi:MAG: 30S ribosomal protein S5 [Legionellales bacterium]|nr:30S ribosomal protein S5 [Legionellales bacterium]|tara:strand:- start:17194 stop:17730 length:537 start_codon:yes stop_codon:yes gene_type:complete
MAIESESRQYELMEKTIVINRTSKVVEGGRIFSFTAVVVVGNGKGKVGFGIGKSDEVPVAVQKATDQAKKSMIQVPLKGNTIQHPITGRHGASRVYMRPASDGTGVIAGGAARAIFEVMGVENVLSKCIGSTTAINVVNATFDGLKRQKTIKMMSQKRGVNILSKLAPKRVVKEGESS